MVMLMQRMNTMVMDALGNARLNLDLHALLQAHALRLAELARLIITTTNVMTETM